MHFSFKRVCLSSLPFVCFRKHRRVRNVCLFKVHDRKGAAANVNNSSAWLKNSTEMSRAIKLHSITIRPNSVCGVFFKPMRHTPAPSGFSPPWLCHKDWGTGLRPGDGQSHTRVQGQGSIKAYWIINGKKSQADGSEQCLGIRLSLSSVSHLRSVLYESVMSCIYAGIYIAVTATPAEIGGWRWSWNWKVVIMSAWGNTLESVEERRGPGSVIVETVFSLLWVWDGAQGERGPTWSQTL